jgi:hypothetical protein
MLKQENKNSVESSKIWNLEQNRLNIIDLPGTNLVPIFDYSLINKMYNGQSFLARFSDNSTSEVRVIDGEFKQVNLS